MAGRPVKVLMVEDSRLQSEIISAASGRLGYQVEALQTGEEVLQQYTVGRYDVLLLDVLLPGISGLEILSAIKARDPSQCIVLMTAEGSGISAGGALDAGADDYLTKPLRMDDHGAELDTTIRRSIGRCELARENTRLHQDLARIGDTAREMSHPLAVLADTAGSMLREAGAGSSRDGLSSLLQATARLTELATRLTKIIEECRKVSATSMGDMRLEKLYER